MAAAPTTLASHTSLLTGSYPHTHGVPRNGYVIDPRNTTLAEVLGAAGFRTRAVVGAYPLSADFGFDAGFETFDEQFTIGVVAGETDQEQRRASAVTDRALELLDRDRLRAGERLFLFAHYFDPHAPYDPPPPWDTRYAEVSGSIDRANLQLIEGVVDHRASLAGEPAPRNRYRDGLTAKLLASADGQPLPGEPGMAALYAGEVSYTDAEVGRLLAGLDERGILDQALVIVTADHGETFWEHGDFWNHGLWVYDTTVRVPLLLRLPGERTERVVETPVSTVDVMPTLLELLGLTAPSRVDGVSLVPLLRGESLDRGPVFSEATQPWHDGAEGWPNAANPRCVRHGPHKYVHAPYLADLEELYDLTRDPGERTNLLTSPATSELLPELRSILEEWGRSREPLPSTLGTVESEAARRKLRSLGYLD